MRTFKNFQSRSAEDQATIVWNAWCDACGQADLGLDGPVEYEEDGVTHISGDCRRCGADITLPLLSENACTER